ncbi:MAG TPA: hypothetical protein VJS44_00390 [Pyrinomonadaceae bacterium]|nr:hypothetical protein [Pyrinomonadaceae bacterium]
MSATLPEFNRGAVRPMECLRAGKDLIKEQYWLFLGITVVGIFIGNAVPMGILMGPMMCGIYLTLFARQRGEQVNFDLLFKGFDYFKESLIATLIQIVPIIVIMLPAYVIMFAFFIMMANRPRRGQPPDVFPLFAFMTVFVVVIMVISIAIGVFFAFTYPLIVDRGLSGMDAIKTSIKAATANLGGVLGLMLLMILISIVGALFCYIGAILVMPVHFAAWSIAYRQVFSNVGETPPAPPGF